MNEYDLIARYFAPLTQSAPEALGLLDDAALLKLKQEGHWTITTDTIVEGVHFPLGERPDLIARKLLRVNLSDLAAMGAKPRYYLLNLALPRSTGENWLARFAQALQQDQTEFGIKLIGGDTTSTRGPAILTLTALGEVPRNSTALMRSGAKPGNVIAVTGTIGDGALGLHLALGNLWPQLTQEQSAFLLQRYRLPKPRIYAALALAPYLTAATDISDGLLGDCERICKASRTGAKLHFKDVPLSGPSKRLLQDTPNLWERIVTGGDDYELLVTMPEENWKIAACLAKVGELTLTRIGTITSGSKVDLLDEKGVPLHPTHNGYQHFTEC